MNASINTLMRYLVIALIMLLVLSCNQRARTEGKASTNENHLSLSLNDRDNEARLVLPIMYKVELPKIINVYYVSTDNALETSSIQKHIIFLVSDISDVYTFAIDVPVSTALYYDFDRLYLYNGLLSGLGTENLAFVQTTPPYESSLPKLDMQALAGSIGIPRRGVLTSLQIPKAGEDTACLTYGDSDRLTYSVVLYRDLGGGVFKVIQKCSINSNGQIKGYLLQDTLLLLHCDLGGQLAACGTLFQWRGSEAGTLQLDNLVKNITFSRKGLFAGYDDDGVFEVIPSESKLVVHKLAETKVDICMLKQDVHEFRGRRLKFFKVDVADVERDTYSAF